MRFEPRAPREGINVTPTHPLREAGTLVLGLVGLLALVGVAIAAGVDLAVRLVPPDLEGRVFPSAGLVPAAGAEETPARVPVQALLERLARHWPEAPYRFRVALTADASPNAAALPGGVVLVTRGVLEAAESENELAFVLGHELGHFRSRDHLRRLGRRVVYGLALAAVLGRAGGARDLGALAGELTSRGFDRGQERAADAFALGIVQREYGHVAAAADFFEHLTAAGAEPGRFVAYFSTHPAGPERAGALRALARERGWSLEGATRPLRGAPPE